MAPTSKEAVVSSPLDINDPELGEKVDLDTVFEKAGLNGGVDLSKSLLPSQSASKEVVPFTGKNRNGACHREERCSQKTANRR